MFYAETFYGKYDSSEHLTDEGLKPCSWDLARFETLEACRDELRLACLDVTAPGATYTISRDTGDDENPSESVESGKIADLIAD